MKRAAIAVVFLLAQQIYAQTLTHSVIGSSGDFFSTSQGSLAWTLGEPMVETYANSLGFFTQGFHQPLSILVTGVIESEQEILIYPNPVRDFLQIRIDHTGEYQIQLFDLQGREITAIHASVTSEAFERSLDLRDHAATLYLLRITSTTSGKTHSYKIEKI